MSNMYEQLRKAQREQERLQQEVLQNRRNHERLEQQRATNSRREAQRREQLMIQQQDRILKQLGVAEIARDSQRFINEGKVFRRWKMERLRGNYTYSSRESTGEYDDGGSFYTDVDHSVNLNGYMLVGPSPKNIAEDMHRRTH